MALHTMVLLAARPDRTLATHEIAGTLGVSEAHLAKVLQRLGRAGLVRSQRGPGGGFSLGRRPEAITLLEVYEVTDGPLEHGGCLLGRAVCDGTCILGGLLEKLGGEVHQYLSHTRLSDLSQNFGREEQHAGA